MKLTLKILSVGFGYTFKLLIEVPPFNLIDPGCVQNIGLVHHERYNVILESQKVLP
jgi:hypothetical protein